MLATIMLLMAGADPTADGLLATHQRLTTVAVVCPDSAAEGEVVVCGRRRADRYRLPFQPAPEPGDPRHEGVPAERERLQAKRDNCREKSAFLIGCGSVGVGVTTGGAGTRVMGLRDLSP